MKENLQRIFDAYKCVIESAYDELEGTHKMFERVSSGEQSIDELTRYVFSISNDLSELGNTVPLSLDHILPKIIENCNNRRKELQP